MLSEFRAAVYDLISVAALAPVWDVIPDDPAELPCIVVGRPSAEQTPTAAIVFNVILDVHVIGRRQQAGGSEAELVALADAVWALFRGTRKVTHLAHSLAVRRIDSREQFIAALGYPAYSMAVESSIATC